MTAEVETLTKTRDNLLTQSERLVIQTTKLEKEIVEHRQQINSNKNTIQQLEKLKQRKFYINVSYIFKVVVVAEAIESCYVEVE